MGGSTCRAAVAGSAKNGFRILSQHPARRFFFMGKSAGFVRQRTARGVARREPPPAIPRIGATKTTTLVTAISYCEHAYIIQHDVCALQGGEVGVDERARRSIIPKISREGALPPRGQISPSVLPAFTTRSDAAPCTTGPAGAGQESRIREHGTCQAALAAGRSAPA